MYGVILMAEEILQNFDLEFIEAIEGKGHKQKAKIFFQLEKELLEQILNLDNNKARSTLRKITTMLQDYTSEFTFDIVKHYFVVISSIISREVYEEFLLNGKNTFIFNAACIEMVENNLQEDNADIIGDELVEFYCYILKERTKPSLSHETVNEVIEYINQHVEEQLIVEEIAKRFNVSTSHLSRIFREFTSVTLIEYITIRKIEEIQYYLRFSDQKISDIAEKFHFCNQSYFTRVFKKYTGLTPGRFRKDLDGNYFRFTLKKDESL